MVIQRNEIASEAMVDRIAVEMKKAIEEGPIIIIWGTSKELSELELYDSIELKKMIRKRELENSAVIIRDMQQTEKKEKDCEHVWKYYKEGNAEKRHCPKCDKYEVSFAPCDGSCGKPSCKGIRMCPVCRKFARHDGFCLRCEEEKVQTVR